MPKQKSIVVFFLLFKARFNFFALSVVQDFFFTSSALKYAGSCCNKFVQKLHRLKYSLKSTGILFTIFDRIIFLLQSERLAIVVRVYIFTRSTTTATRY